jgi:hypothetical protein
MRHRAPSYYVLILLLLPLVAFSAVGSTNPHKRPAAARAAPPPPQEVDVVISLPPPTPRISADDGWKFLYGAGSGLAATGSLEKLLEASRNRAGRVGVMFATFDGNVSGVCSNVSVARDGQVDCDLEIWCNQPNDAQVPDRHGHTAHLRSTGSISYAVITLNERGERKILGLGDSDAFVAWYAK